MKKKIHLSSSQKTNYKFYLTKKNKKLIYIGSSLMIIGYILMIGGASQDLNTFDSDSLYSFRRITLSPLLIFGGIIIILIGIIRKSPTSSNTEK